MQKNFRLSKSKVIAGLQCHKCLWLTIHRPELIKFDEGTERLFAIGHEVGDVARQQFPDGILIENQENLTEAIEETARVLKEHPDKPFYEATFTSGNILVRADIFQKENEGYRLIEIKAATRVKAYYLNDVAVQAWVIKEAGYPIEKAIVGVINTGFVYEGEQNYEGLFSFIDITERIKERMRFIPTLVSEFQSVLNGDMPDIKMGKYCTDPNSCAFMEFCQGELPEPTAYPVELLPRGGNVVLELKSRGIIDIREIPAGDLKKELHEKVRRVTVSGRAEVEPEIGEYIKGLEYPLYYMDMETIQFPVPIYGGTRPYQQLPFQYSVHIEDKEGNLEHKEFLDISGEAPMKKLAEGLIDDLGERGAVCVYSAFEKARLAELAAMYPDLKPKLDKIVERLVDLLPLVRKYYYHKNMKGSWSIKTVLPTVAPDLDYGSLEEVKDGTGAQTAFLEAINSETRAERKEELRARMLEYCKMDTMGMVRLVEFFRR